jgi:regulator of PEP synthase PpsR (kinase-PPPase family)
MEEIAAAPGIVVHTIVDPDLRGSLEEVCRALDVTCLAALDPLTLALGRYLGAAVTSRVGAQHALDTDYFNRMEALNFAIGHDDGQSAGELETADVVLVGISRTSKTPTCIYLAHRGVRAANVPLVPDQPLPEKLFQLTRPMIVALTASPDRLIQVRRNRLLSQREEKNTAYTDVDAVREETVRARRLYERHGWPVIDVTRRSVEETAAAIVNLLTAGRGKVELLG